MLRIKTGDTVIVHKPLDVNEWPQWTKDMEDCDGVVAQVANVLDVSAMGSCAFLTCKDGSVSTWAFNVEWLSLYELFEAADLDYFLRGE